MKKRQAKAATFLSHARRRSGEGNMPRRNSTAKLIGYLTEAFKGFGLPSFSRNFWPTEAGSMLSQNLFHPSLNVSSDNESYQVSLEAPGLTQADMSIEVRDDVLTIKGHKKEEQETKDKHFYRIERQYGTFQRTLSLPEDSVADEIQANMKDGVLQIRIPRREPSDSNVKTIAIK